MHDLEVVLRDSNADTVELASVLLGGDPCVYVTIHEPGTDGPMFTIDATGPEVDIPMIRDLFITLADMLEHGEISE